MKKRSSITVGYSPAAILIDESFIAGISDMEERFIHMIITIFL